jgi:hypothetical protein
VEIAENSPEQTFEREQLLAVTRHGDRFCIEVAASQDKTPVRLIQTENDSSLWINIFPDPFANQLCRSHRNPCYQVKGIITEHIDT